MLTDRFAVRPAFGLIDHLRRTGDPVDAFGKRTRAVGLYADIEACCVEGVEERFVHLQGWFSARQDKHFPPLVRYIVEVEGFGYDLAGGHLCIFGEIGITPRTAKVTSAESHKHRRDATMCSFALKRIKYFVNAITQIFKSFNRSIVHLIDGGVAFGFLDGDLIAVLHVVANPAGDIFRRRVDVQHFVDVLVVKGIFDYFLDMREIRHHAVCIQFFRLAIDDDDPVMTMQVLAFALVTQHEIMRRGNLYSLFYVIHFNE